MAGSLVALTAAFTLQPVPTAPPASQAPQTRSVPTLDQHPNAAPPLTLDDADVRAARLIADPAASVPASGSAGSLEEVTGRLAARLAASGGTSEDWRLLAQSYEYLGRAQQAQEARSHIAPP